MLLLLNSSIPSLTLSLFLFPWGCSEIPSLESDPPKTCFVGDSVTLTCRVTEGTPSARLTWLRGITQPEAEIQPGGRYLITQEGNVSRLTIQNCSQATDGGCYVCKAQNPVGLRELFVCLTVKREWGLWGHSSLGPFATRVFFASFDVWSRPLMLSMLLWQVLMQDWLPSAHGEKDQFPSPQSNGPERYILDPSWGLRAQRSTSKSQAT